MPPSTVSRRVGDNRRQASTPGEAEGATTHQPNCCLLCCARRNRRSTATVLQPTCRRPLRFHQDPNVHKCSQPRTVLLDWPENTILSRFTTGTISAVGYQDEILGPTVKPYAGSVGAGLVPVGHLCFHLYHDSLLLQVSLETIDGLRRRSRCCIESLHT